MTSIILVSGKSKIILLVFKDEGCLVSLGPVH